MPIPPPDESNSPKKAQKTEKFLAEIPDEEPNFWIDWIDLAIRLVSRLIVLGLGWSVLRVGWILYFGSDASQYPGIVAIQKIAEHWPVLSLILVPLFYLPVRRLIYRAKAFGDNPETKEQALERPNAPKVGTGTPMDAGSPS